MRLVLVVLLAGAVWAAPKLSPAVLADQDVSGQGQAGETGLYLGRPFAVQVTDNGRPVPGARVQFEVLTEPLENRSQARRAALADSVVLTDQMGMARTRLRLGATPGEYRVLAVSGGKRLVLAAMALRRNWYFVTVIEFLGGLTLFLFGLYYGSKGLRRMAGNRLRELLFSLTSRRVLGALVGVVVTVVFQSSSATTVLLMGMASAGILALGQALAVILGADIGTTVTVQLLAFRVFDYALLVAVAGFILMNSARRVKDLGQAIFGFGLVFYSLKVVIDASEPLRYVPQVMDAVGRLGSVPWLGLVLAMLFTALVRSSAATIGVIVGLSFTGLVDLATAIPYILGANLGSSFSAVIASWRGGLAARRIGLGHLLFKLVIVALCLPFVPMLVKLAGLTAHDLPRQIANAHTLVNVFAAVLFLPLLVPFQRLLERLVKPRKAEQFGPRYLDSSSLEAPELASAQATREVLRMADRVSRMYDQAIKVFLSRDKEGRRELIATDDQVDRLEEDITAFLARISQEELSEPLSHKVVALFYITDELEHIADVVSKNLAAYTKKSIEQGLAFSAEGLEEMERFHAEVGENLKTAVACITTWDTALAKRLVERKEWGVLRQRELHNRHLGRLSRGLAESIDTSTIHLDFISDIERINFHCSQIGAAVLGTHHPEKDKGPSSKD